MTSRRKIDPLSQDTTNPSKMPRLPEHLELVCQACGHVAEYDFGALVISPSLTASTLEQQEYEDFVSSTGYLRCHQCRASGQWRFTDRTRAELRLKFTDMMVENRLPPGVVMGESILFDGTTSRDLADGEDYLRSLIAKTPDHYYLYSRLANLLLKAGLKELAEVELQHALELNRHDSESWHDLGCLFQESDSRDEANHAFQLTLRFLHLTTHASPEFKREIVLDTLDRLFQLNASASHTSQCFDFLPQVEPNSNPQSRSADRASDTRTATINGFDLLTKDGWERVVSYYINGVWPAKSRPAERPSAPPSSMSIQRFAEPRNASDFGLTPALHSRRVGRNEPCPCGSGKKSKKCCNS